MNREILARGVLFSAQMQSQSSGGLEAAFAAYHRLQPGGSHRRTLLAQNGLLTAERVRDPLVTDAIVVSIGERARVMDRGEFRAWLEQVRRALDDG